MDWWEIKKEFNKAKQRLSEVVEIAVEKMQPVRQEAEKTIEDLKEKAKPIIEEAATKISSYIEEKTKTINTNQKDMQHKVLMLGGRRAGKSTILSSILHELDTSTPGSVCTITDVTDYTQLTKDQSGKEYRLLSLKDKRREIKKFIKDHDRLDNANKHINFVIDMAPNYAAGSYELLVKASQNPQAPTLTLKFDDVPGEWMVSESLEHATLKAKIKESDIFVIAIDTPFLMQEKNEELNDVYNRIDEITSALTSSISIADAADRKQIILCPVKCEKWTNAGQADLVTEKVCKAYKKLINTWVKNENVHIWVMPINTAGCVVSSKLLPAKLYFKDESDRTGTACSYDELTGIIIDKDGRTIDKKDVDRVEDDAMWNLEFNSKYVDIPLSWFHCNGLPFSTRFCEQPAFHILKFIVEKEENVNIEKARKEQMSYERKNWFEKFLTKIFKPTFGQYLPVWKEVIGELDRWGLIKTSGDGFKRITEFID